MATVSSISSHSCEAPPSLVRLPLVTRENLRLGVSYDASSTQGIASILLSATDFTNFDLSKLQLFSADGRAEEPMSSREVISPQTEVEPCFEKNVSLHSPWIRNSVADLPPGAIDFPIIRSKGVVEAQKASAEHNLLKCGAVSPSPRARKKAFSMDEISLNESLGSSDVWVPGNMAEQSSRGDRGSVSARRELPELELAALPPPGLEQRAETLRKKHFERVLNRTFCEISREEAKNDLKASPTAKFLLQVMPWELTQPMTPVRTPAAIPFMWEDVPGRPKPLALPSGSPSLPLPPRLLPAPSASSTSAVVAPTGTLAWTSADSTKNFLPHVDGKQLSPTKSNYRHHRRHRKNMHSWHVLHNLLSGSYQQCPSPVFDESSETRSPTGEGKNLSVASSDARGDGVSLGSSSVNWNSTSSDLSSSLATASDDSGSSHDSNFGTRFELPPIYVAPVVPFTPPHRDLGPLEDRCGKPTNRMSYLARLFRLGKHQKTNMGRTRSFSNAENKHGKLPGDSNCYLLDDANGGRTRSEVVYGMQTDQFSSESRLEVASGIRTQNDSAQISPTAASVYGSPKPHKAKIQMGSGRLKVFLKLRKRGARVIVASYRAVKRALFFERASHSNVFKHAHLPYQTLLR